MTIPVIEEYNQLYWLFYSVVGLMVPLMIQRLIRRTALPFNNKYNDTPTIYRHRKGLSILCIVLLHYGLGAFPNQINVFIGSFMITAFYVTSGWVDGMSTKSCL